MLQRLCDRLASFWSKLTGWRTVLFGALVAASGAFLLVLEYLVTIDMSLFFTPRTAAIVQIAVGLVVIVLRYVTTTSLGGKPEDE